MDINKLRDKILSYSKLEDNWDTYGSKPISVTSIARAVFILGALEHYIEDTHVFNFELTAEPRVDGLIQIDIDTKEKILELTVLIDDDFIAEYMLDNNGEIEEDQIQDIEELEYVFNKLFF